MGRQYYCEETGVRYSIKCGLHSSTGQSFFNPYPAGTESDQHLSPVQSQASLHIRAVYISDGPIVAAIQLQIVMLIMSPTSIVVEQNRLLLWQLFFLVFFFSFVLFYLNTITILHWLPVKTGKSCSKVTIYGGNEALPSYCFKQLPKSQISRSLPEASV